MRPRSFYIAILVGYFCTTVSLFYETALAQESGMLDEVYEQAGLDQKLGDQIPSGLVFYDESGDEVVLDSFFQADRPVLLTMVYHSCPMLCSVLLDALTETMTRMDWTAGTEFEIVTVSIDPEEKVERANEKKKHYIDKLKRPEAASGWHFLTGDEASIKALAAAVGIRYARIEEIGQFVHPPILTFLSNERRVSRYLQGLSFEPRNIRLALVEASDGKVGSPIDFVALYCLQYDPEENTYVAHAANLMRLGGFLTVLALGAMLFAFWRREGQVSASP